MEFSKALFEEGVMGTGIAFPTVPEGKARVRTIVTAAHSQDELSRALEILERVGQKDGVDLGDSGVDAVRQPRRHPDRSEPKASGVEGSCV